MTKDTIIGVEFFTSQENPNSYMERALGTSQAGAGENEFARQEKYKKKKEEGDEDEISDDWYEVAADGSVYDRGFDPMEPRDWHGRWSEFAESVRQKYLAKHPKMHGEVSELIDDFDRAMEDARYFTKERDWYARHKPLAKKLFGKYEPMFEKILSATSIQQQPKANVHDAILAMEHWLTHGNFEGYTRGLTATREKLKEIAETGEVTGPKIGPFSANLQGDWSKVTIDRWMLRFFFKHPTGEHGGSQRQQHQVATELVIAMAKQLGWKPAELQAVLWATARYRGGDFAFNPQDFARHLEKEAAGVRKFLDEHRIAHDAAPLSAEAAILAKLFLRLLDMAVKLFEEIAKSVVRDAGFDPNEPRDWHGRWAQAIFSGIEGLTEHVTITKLSDLSDELYREAKKEFGATDTKQLDSKGHAAADGIIEAFSELQEKGLYRPGSVKNVQFIFADMDESKKGLAMMTGHDSSENTDDWVINTNGFDFAVKKIRMGETINFPQMMALKALRENPHMTDEDILRVYYKGCMEHEYAHLLDNSMSGLFSRMMLDTMYKEILHLPYGARAVEDEDIEKFLRAIRMDISEYSAAVVPEETFAEGFVRWLHDPYLPPYLKHFYEYHFTRSQRMKMAIEKQMREFNPLAKDAGAYFEPYPNPKYLDKDGNVIPDRDFAPEAATDAAYDRYNPAEPRDWHGRWTKGGGEKQLELPLGNKLTKENDWRLNPLNEEDLTDYIEDDVRSTIDPDFPNMRNYEVVGAPNNDYNCIAWAFGFEDKWWNPGAYHTEQIDEALTMYQSKILLGQDILDNLDKAPARGRVKLALFEDGGRFCHMTRQLPDGRWTSKFGGNGKTAQRDLREMEGGMYGEITRLYDMPITEFSRFRKEHKNKRNPYDWL